MIIHSYPTEQITLSPPCPSLVDLGLMILESVLNDARVFQKLLPNIKNIKSKLFYHKPDISGSCLKNRIPTCHSHEVLSLTLTCQPRPPDWASALVFWFAFQSPSLTRVLAEKLTSSLTPANLSNCAYVPAIGQVFLQLRWTTPNHNPRLSAPGKSLTQDTWCYAQQFTDDKHYLNYLKYPNFTILWLGLFPKPNPLCSVHLPWRLHHSPTLELKTVQ